MVLLSQGGPACLIPTGSTLLLSFCVLTSRSPFLGQGPIGSCSGSLTLTGRRLLCGGLVRRLALIRLNDGIKEETCRGRLPMGRLLAPPPPHLRPPCASGFVASSRLLALLCCPKFPPLGLGLLSDL